ncbi:hypothetical protein NDU88_000815 [Pleurodeles waltl]|uniref:Uncharacterized protein n=1 Tax=Pleurodeles waltl TaxID=8319 RepID=A0AAV7MJ68_PLEWA|nr:hypothetical protein NDU88_000815 [Pleurodeles waltl]
MECRRRAEHRVKGLKKKSRTRRRRITEEEQNTKENGLDSRRAEHEGNGLQKKSRKTQENGHQKTKENGHQRSAEDNGKWTERGQQRYEENLEARELRRQSSVGLVHIMVLIYEDNDGVIDPQTNGL